MKKPVSFRSALVFGGAGFTCRVRKIPHPTDKVTGHFCPVSGNQICFEYTVITTGGAVEDPKVIMDGKAIRSCVTEVKAAANRPVTTLEGLGTTKKLHPLQKAFIEEQAGQCCYCISGIIMSAKVLLDNNPNPTVADIKEALTANLCRCGSHLRIVRAIRRAARQQRV